MPDRPIANEMEALRASWTWVPIEPPYQHLQLHGKPLTVFGGAVLINYPTLMNAHPTGNPSAPST